MRFVAMMLVVGAFWIPASAQCPAEPPVQNFTGGGNAVCPCFLPGEEAGATFTLPPSVFPIEILKVGIGWGSQFGGNPQQLENAINIYEGGLPNPGAPIFSLPGPALNDGVINEFDLEPLPGEIIVNSSPITVTLNFANQNAGVIFAPSVVHDGNGCQPGKNVIKDNTGQWIDACAAGLTGDWVFYMIYRPLACSQGPGLIGETVAIARAAAGQIELQWAGSCSGSVDDYGVYEGVLGFFPSHVSKLCSTANATSATFSPAPLSTYYLVVPQSAGTEGTYGTSSQGAPRPTGGGQCQIQVAGVCP